MMAVYVTVNSKIYIQILYNIQVAHIVHKHLDFKKILLYYIYLLHNSIIFVFGISDLTGTKEYICLSSSRKFPTHICRLVQ